MFVLAPLALGSLACNLSASAPTATPRPFLPTATPFALPTTHALSFPTLTPRPIVPTSPPVIVTPCTQRQDWTFIYTVQTGDYLASIATRASTTVNEVTAANCLANPNFIAVGQRLRLPRQPVAAQRDAQSDAGCGNVDAPARRRADDPGLCASIRRLAGVGNAIQIGIGQVQVSAVNVTNAVRVTFYIANTGQNPTILGDDTDSRDGWAVPYTNLSSSLNAQIWAIATSATGQTAQTPSYALVFAANTTPTIGALSISPSTTNADGSLGIRPGQLTVSASRRSECDARAVLFRAQCHRRAAAVDRRDGDRRRRHGGGAVAGGQRAVGRDDRT